MKKKIFITGVGGGFGVLISQELSKRGHQVYGTLRDPKGRNSKNREILERLGVGIYEMEVTDTTSVNTAVASVLEASGGIDVVINNAGIGVLGLQETFTESDLHKVFDINVFGVQRVNRAFLPHFRKKKDGLLIHISSLLGRMTVPFYGPYNASKWALEALAENTRTESSSFGIEVCIVEPGGFPTSFIANLLRPSDKKRIEELGELAQFPEQFLKNFEENLGKNPEQDPKKVATAVSDLVDLPKGEKPFRTIVDFMGMGSHIEGYNQSLHQITSGIYSAFGISHLLQVKKEE